MKIKNSSQMRYRQASRGIDDGGLGIRDIFIEKDYWICRSLRLMALADLLSDISQRSTIMDGYFF